MKWWNNQKQSSNHHAILYIAIKDWREYTNDSYATWGVVFLLFNRSTLSKAFLRSISGSTLQTKVKQKIIILTWMIYKPFDMQMKYKCTSNHPRWFYFLKACTWMINIITCFHNYLCFQGMAYMSRSSLRKVNLFIKIL